MRRRVLLAVLGLAALAACFWWLRSPAADEPDEAPPNFADSVVLGARPAPPLEEIRFQEGGPELSFFALGDTGWGGVALRANAGAMERSAEQRPVDLVLLLGDNFYRSGAESLDDPRWKTHFEDAFAGERLQVPFYAVLGNHDHYGDPKVEIEYSARSTRWRMPAPFYTFSMPLRGGGEVQFFAIDTQPFHRRSSWAGDEVVRWLGEELARSRARWKIVFGHHPVLSHGAHGPTEEVAREIGPLFEKQGVDLYISGHDHDLQLLRSDAGWLQLVSGAGSSTRDTGYGEGTLFAAASPGYARVDLSSKEMWIEIATASGGPRFRWRVAKP